MKCIKLARTYTMNASDTKRKINIYRVSEKTAKTLVDSGHAKFVSKSVWKKYGRKYMEKGAK